MTSLRFLIGFCALSFSASATVITLAPSTQAVTFTGTGLNSSGTGTSRIGWGACVYDGTSTTCTVSGPYTGLGSGGTYTFLLNYPGNGASPLSAIAAPEGGDLVTFNLTAGSLTGFITPSDTGTPVNFYDLRFSVFFDPNNDLCTGVPACAVGAVGDSTNGTITGPVHGTFDLTPVITAPGGVISASAYGGFGAIAPATWIEIYGLNLATTQQQVWGSSDFNGAQAPSTLGGTMVTIGGKPAFVDYVSPHQVNAQVPSGLDAGSQDVVVTTYGGASTSFPITTNAVEPGLLASSPFKLAAGQYVVAQFPDGLTYVLPPGAIAGLASNRAKPGDTIVLYGIGFGPVTPDIQAGLIVSQTTALSGFAASIAGVPAQVNFAGFVQGFLGLYQFNIVVPNVGPSDTAPLTFTLNGAAGTQTLLIAIGS